MRAHGRVVHIATHSERIHALRHEREMLLGCEGHLLHSQRDDLVRELLEDDHGAERLTLDEQNGSVSLNGPPATLC